MQSALKRPVQLLYPLEIHCELDETCETGALVNETPNDSSLPSQTTLDRLLCPRPVAAQRTEEL